VVAEALRRLAADGADLSSPVMIGDRSPRHIGAAVHDVPTIFVTWGYGRRPSGPCDRVVDSGADCSRALGL
jgi:phosphoglycolate phosphatase